jgi:hypothetical protein
MNSVRKYLFLSILFLSVLLFQSCRPKGILSQKEMTDVLYDIHLAESITNNGVLEQHREWTEGLDDNYFRDLTYLSVLEKYKITEEDFFNSVAYYSKDLKTYSKIYDNVEKRFSELYEDIQNGIYDTDLTNKFKLSKEDSTRIRNYYTKYGYINDTTNFFKNSIYPDSVPTWSANYTKEWPKNKSDKHDFYVIDPKNYVILKEITADTTTVEDTLKKPDVVLTEKKQEIRKVGDGLQVVIN